MGVFNGYQKEDGNRKEITLEAVLKKIESHDIIVNVDRLMSTK